MYEDESNAPPPYKMWSYIRFNDENGFCIMGCHSSLVNTDILQCVLFVCSCECSC